MIKDMRLCQKRDQRSQSTSRVTQPFGNPKSICYTLEVTVYAPLLRLLGIARKTHRPRTTFMKEPSPFTKPSMDSRIVSTRYDLQLTDRNF